MNDRPDAAQWQPFEGSVGTLEAQAVSTTPTTGDKVACPCCGYKTLAQRGAYEICPVCYWEDDGHNERNAEAIQSGPNGTLSLRQAQANFQEFKACDRHFIAHVRPPKPEEI